MFKNKLVMGFYESPRFFDSIKDIIREDFSVEMNSDYVKKSLKIFYNKQPLL